jgi:magnesium transporter
MARESRGLSEAFAAAHPAEAAQVLESLPSAQTAALLAALPVKIAAGVVKRMAPPYSARCAEALDESTLMALAQVLGPQPTAALLSHLPPEQQALALERLPVAVAVAVRMLIGYPRDTAGSWMEPWPLALAPDTPAGEATEQLRRFEGAPHDVVFVVESEWRVAGVVTAVALLRAGPRQPLSHLMRQPAPSVSALTPVASLREHPGWHDLPVLAVVERQDRLVGALQREAWLAAMARSRPLAASPAAGETLTALGSAYWQSVAALAQLAVSVLPSVTRIGGKEDKNER